MKILKSIPFIVMYATLIPKVVSRDLVDMVDVSADVGGDTFANDGKKLLVVLNGATELNVTMDTPGTIDGEDIGNKTTTIAINKNTVLGPFPTNLYNQADGTVNITYDQVTGVTVGLITIP